MVGHDLLQRSQPVFLKLAACEGQLVLVRLEDAFERVPLFRGQEELALEPLDDGGLLLDVGLGRGQLFVQLLHLFVHLAHAVVQPTRNEENYT